MLRIPTGGKGIRRCARNDIHPRHGEVRPLAEGSDHAHQLGGLCLGNLPGPIHPQDDLVGIPVGTKVHQEGEEESNDHPLSPPEIVSEDNEEACHGPQK